MGDHLLEVFYLLNNAKFSIISQVWKYTLIHNMPKPYFLVVMVVVFASDFCGTVSAGWCDSDDHVGKITLEFQRKINQYRNQLGMPSLTCHWSLVQTAYVHTKNQLDYGGKYEPSGQGCDAHSWYGDVLSAPGSETAKKCCFDLNDDTTHSCMWKKPQEIAGWKALGEDGNGFEISHGLNDCPRCTKVSVDSAIKGWKKSSGHDDVLRGKGGWAKLTKIGCYFENAGANKYANCWLSE